MTRATLALLAAGSIAAGIAAVVVALRVRRELFEQELLFTGHLYAHERMPM